MEIDLKLHGVTMGGGRVRSRKVKFYLSGLFKIRGQTICQERESARVGIW